MKRMFWEILKTRLKVLVREKDILFWAFCFPICLSTILYMAVYRETSNINAAYSAQVLDSVECVSVLKGCVNYKESYFLAIIAQACLIMGFMGIREAEDNSGYAKGARINIAPVKKYIVLSAGISSAWLLAFFCIATLIIYLESILGISLGPQRIWQGIVLGLGILSGILLGMSIGFLSHRGRIFKQGVVAVLFLILTVLAGLIETEIAYYVTVNYPLLAKCNPAILIVDALYQLKFYGASEIFFKDVGSLGFINIVLIGLVIAGERRQQK